jgi:hypothetical protein
MTATRRSSIVEFDDKRTWADFRSAGSLHAHTHHSREVMSDLTTYLLKIPLVGLILRRELQAFTERTGDTVDFSNGWWHPPVTPREVFDGEVQQIERRFGLFPLVSVTDHDDITATVQLRGMYAERCAPISFEWTVPFHAGYFHLGVHNLPSATASDWFDRLAAFTAGQQGETLEDLLAGLNAMPEVLLVLNHPCWDLAGVGAAAHKTALAAFMTGAGRCVHAVEFNGYRSRNENNQARALAAAFDLPVVSGGDRHGCAANAVLNVTASQSFAELTSEIRDGVSLVVVMPEYRQHLAARTMACAADVLRRYPWFPPGRRHWTDRVSWRSDGGVRPLSFHWPTGGPIWVRSAIGTFQVVASPIVLPLVRAALDRVDPEGTGA